MDTRYLAHAGYMLAMAGVTSHSLITAVDGKPVTDLDSAKELFAAIPDGQRSTIRFRVSLCLSTEENNMECCAHCMNL